MVAPCFVFTSTFATDLPGSAVDRAGWSVTSEQIAPTTVIAARALRRQRREPVG